MQLQEIRTILAAAEAIGATIPAGITTAIDNWTAAANVADALQPPQLGDLADQIATANSKTLAKIIETAATRSITHDRARELVLATQGHIAHRIAHELRGQAGADLIRSLRPTFDTAAQAITDCGFSPDTAVQPQRVIDLGDDAVRNLRTLPEHAAQLERIYRNVIMPLVHQLDLLPEPDTSYSRPGVRFIAMVIDGNHTADIARAAGVFGGALGSGEPGMGWHRLATSGFRLRLNTPAEAAELIEAANQAADEQKQQRQAKEREVTRQLAERVRLNPRAFAQ